MGTPGSEVLVNLSPMTALWTPTEDGRERLLLVRLVRIEEKEVCQGIVLDDAALRGCWRTRSPTCSRRRGCCRCTSRSRRSPSAP